MGFFGLYGSIAALATTLTLAAVINAVGIGGLAPEREAAWAAVASRRSSEIDSGKEKLVPGHEVIGVIEATGERVKGLKPGDRVGLGWFSGSCMACQPCMSGRLRSSRMMS